LFSQKYSVASINDFFYSANQKVFTKILFSDWLFQFCKKIQKFHGKSNFLQNNENLVILEKLFFKKFFSRITRFSSFFKMVLISMGFHQIFLQKSKQPIRKQDFSIFFLIGGIFKNQKSDY
jgi:hypothetical protein